MRSAFIGLCFLACAACSVQSTLSPGDTSKPKELRFSSTLGVHQLAGSYGAFSDGQKLEIFVAILGDGFVRLGDGDDVRVDVNGTAVTLAERIEGDDRVHYVAELSPPPAEPVVTVTFTRRDEKVVATVRVAPAFEPKAPPSAIKLGDKVALDVEPRPDPAEWQGTVGPLILHAVELHGDCLDKGEQKLLLGGGYPLSWDTSAIKLAPGSKGCELDVQLRLETVAPPYDGLFSGAFDGLQHRRFKVALTTP